MKTKTLFISAAVLAVVTLSSFTAVNPPKQTVINSRAEGHFVGELFGGGIIYSVTKHADGTEHGLIASLKNLSDGVEWSNKTNVVTNATSSSDGAANTTAILKAGAPKADAAGLCDTYTEGEFSDWYLPSVEELKLMHSNSANINKILESKGQIVESDFYWSSTETGRGSANGIDFSAGTATSSNKLRNAYVRAVRAF